LEYFSLQRLPSKAVVCNDAPPLHVTFPGRTAAGSCHPENNRRAGAGARRAAPNNRLFEPINGRSRRQAAPTTAEGARSTLGEIPSRPAPPRPYEWIRTSPLTLA